MNKNSFVLLVIAGSSLLFSCNNGQHHKVAEDNSVKNKILQQKDGSISLKVDKADCYHDVVNPASNTAEWNVVVSKSGRYNVWLSSATRDTTNLNYQHSVMLSILDERLERRPSIDKIVHNSSDVSYPYFRADSFMGTLYIQDTGFYSIQVISDKITPKDLKKESSASDDSKLISVSLTPAL
jgi:hypothetical protein